MADRLLSSFPVDITQARSSATLRLLSSAVTSLHLALGQCATLLQLAAGEFIESYLALHSLARYAAIIVCVERIIWPYYIATFYLHLQMAERLPLFLSR